MVLLTQAAFGLAYRQDTILTIFYISRFISGVSTGISSFLVPLYSTSKQLRS
jgi:hypothetical protein